MCEGFCSMTEVSLHSSSGHVQPVSAYGIGKYDSISWLTGSEEER